MKTIVWIKPIGGTALDERPMVELEGRKTIAVEKLNEQLKAQGYEYSRTSYMDMAIKPNFTSSVRI